MLETKMSKFSLLLQVVSSFLQFSLREQKSQVYMKTAPSGRCNNQNLHYSMKGFQFQKQ